MEAAARRGWRVIGEVVPNNLPRYLTSFVGRRTDLSALKSLVARSRMVTVTGPGGVGKSRLAAELVRARHDNWPEGIWWVELAPVVDPRQMPGTVVSALDLDGRGRAKDVVAVWLAAKQTLLVLDNCEHLVAACADFCQELLDRCPQLTIIATSREHLGVAGEARWPVSSLAAPHAVELFEARARLAVPDFKVIASNRESVTEICERLDRLPLAIELAAARVGTMAEQEILRQLSDRFHLLTGGSRTAPERLQAMRAAIDWSYRLLAEDEATLFRRLSVFRGGFTVDSAQAVASDQPTASVLDPLSGLVQKSMVVVERKSGSGGRYRLLESQVAYAEDRLREAGELEIIRRRHYEYFSDRFSAATISYRNLRATAGPSPGFVEAEWIAHESGNLWAAMWWARSNADDLGLGLAADLSKTRYGDLAQVRSLLEELLSRSSAKGLARVYALGSASVTAYRQGDYEVALVHAEAGLAHARDLGDIEELAYALHLVGVVHVGRGELATAAEMLEDATSLLQDSSNPRLLAFIRLPIALMAIRRGDCTTAQHILEECLITSRAAGDVYRTAYYLDTLALAQRGRNEHQAAAASWKEALPIQRGLKHQTGIINSFEGLSCVAEALGDDRRAFRLAAAAARISGEMSYRNDSSTLVEDSRGRSRVRLGARESEKAWREGWSMSLDRAADYALGESDSEAGVEADLLSRREREVARLVAAGMTNRQIGERLFISWRTVEGHLERIRNKLGVRSRTEVATWAVDRGLMTTASVLNRAPVRK